MSRSSLCVEWPIPSLHATLQPGRETQRHGHWGHAGHLVANLPDLWDFIQPKLCRLALSLLYAGQKVHPGSYSEAAEYESRPERKNRRRLPPIMVFINYVAPIPSCNNRCHLRSLGCANIPLDASLNGLPMEANHRLAEPSQFEGYRRRYCRCAGSQRQNAEKHLLELVQRTAFILTCRSVSKSEVPSITPLAMLPKRATCHTRFTICQSATRGLLGAGWAPRATCIAPRHCAFLQHRAPSQTI